MLLIQEYLKNHSLKQLENDHGVFASFSKSGHKASFNYGQLEAKDNDVLAQQCRGLVLAAKDGHSFINEAKNINNKLVYDDVIMGETVVLAAPMFRFFNYGQAAAPYINWSDPKLSIYPKLDGTLIIVYKDIFTNSWCCATRSVPEADIPLDNGMFTFRTLFEKALNNIGTSFEELTTEYLVDKYTYCFELTGPYNTVVVPYSETSTTLLAVRDLKTMQELDLEEDGHVLFLEAKVPRVRTRMHASMEALVEWVSTLSPSEQEGVVVKDGNFNRVKVKSAAYVACHKLNDRLNSSQRNLMELILSEKDDDVAQLLPVEIFNNLKLMKSGLLNAIHRHDEMFSTLKSTVDYFFGAKKDFAILLNKQKNIWSAPLFQMYDGKVSNFHDFIMKNKKDGTWSDSFLDKLIEISKT